MTTDLTALHEGGRASPWAVSDAPPDFVQAQLRGIVGLRMPITRLEGKRKMSQNRNAADRAGVATGLAMSEGASDREAGAFIPLLKPRLLLNNRKVNGYPERCAVSTVGVTGMGVRRLCSTTQ